jgi:hypothetical protein
VTVRFDFSRYDRAGRQLEVTGTGDDIMVRADDPYTNRGRRVHACHELDSDAAIALAHDLLERVLSVADCDEIAVAVAALRVLARRYPPDPDDRFSERDIDWAALDDAQDKVDALFDATYDEPQLDGNGQPL